jgi:hypothetical protein
LAALGDSKRSAKGLKKSSQNMLACSELVTVGQNKHDEATRKQSVLPCAIAKASKRSASSMSAVDDVATTVEYKEMVICHDLCAF